MIFGKPGKNLGLSYNSQTKKLAFEFWTKGEKEDKFNQVTFPDISEKEINSGITVSIIYSAIVVSISISFTPEVNSLEILI